MSWDRGDAASEIGGAGTRWEGSRARLWSLVLLGVAVLILAFLAGLLVSGSRASSASAAATGPPLERLQTLLGEVESAERGYLVSGREEEARVHEAAAREIESTLALSAATRSRSGAEPSPSALEALVGEVLSSSRESVRLRREHGLEAASARSLSAVALAPERLRRLLGDLAAEQRARLEAQEAELQGQISRRTLIAFAAGLVAVLAAALAFAASPRRRDVTEFVDLGAPDALPTLDAAGRVGDVFRALLDALDDAVVAVDEHGRVFASNAAADAALGLSQPRPGADGQFGLYLAEAAGSAAGKESPLLRALKGEILRGATFFVGPSTKEASRRVSVNARPVRSGSSRQLRGAVVVLKDVTELQNTAAALRESEEKFGRLFENAPFGIVSIGRDGRIQTANPAFCRFLGFSGEQLVGREAAALTPRPDPREATLLRELLAGGRDSYQVEKSCRTSEDVTRWLRWTVSAVRDAEGAVLFTLASVDDITQPRRLEGMARRSQEILRSVLDAVPVGVWIVDRAGTVRLSNPEGRMIWANKGDILRFPGGEYKGRWADTAKRIEPHEWGALAAIESGEPLLDKVIEVQRFDGTFRRLLTSSVPFRKPDGSVGGAIVINQDITKEGWTSEQRLRLEAELHQAVLQASTLRGLLPVCPVCEKTREDPAYWKRVRTWLGEHIAEMREHACRECQSRSYELSGDLLDGKPAAEH